MFSSAWQGPLILHHTRITLLCELVLLHKGGYLKIREGKDLKKKEY